MEHHGREEVNSASFATLKSSGLEDTMRRESFPVIGGLISLISTNNQPRHRAKARQRRACHLTEALEVRQLLSIVVNTTADQIDAPNSPTISLRDAIATANASSSPTTITFDPTVFATAQTIILGGTKLELTNTNQPTTITGPAAGVTISAAQQSLVLQVDSAVTSSLSNITLANGFTANSTSAGQDGSGVYNSGNLTLTNATVTGNTIQNTGSGLGTGVGIYNAGTLTLTNVILSNNTLSSTTLGGSGAGLYNGGAANLTNVTVTGNTITGTYIYGAGIMNVGIATINNTTVSNNTGGGIYNGGSATISNTTISSNTNQGALFGGGGLSNDGTASLTNVTVSGNTMSGGNGGGGIYNDPYGNLTLINDTVAGNSATGTGNGGGIANLATAGKVSIGNTIVAGNNAVNLGPDVYSALTSVGYNLIGETDASTGWLTSDRIGTTASPLSAALGALANNGGPTLTMLPLPGSPAIDHGSNALIPGGITTDQRGWARISNAIVDIGAVEGWQLTPPAGQIATAEQDALFNLGSFTPTLAAGPYSVDVNWGDGSADDIYSVAAAGAIPQQSHSFSAIGNYTVSATVTDSSNYVSSTATFAISVIAAINSWVAPAGGDWDDAGNWSLGHVPDDSEAARINLAGSYTVTHSQSITDSVDSITSNQAITLSAGTLNIGTTFSLDTASLTLAGGTINGGTISATGGAELLATSSGGTLNGVTLNANLNLTAGNGNVNVHVINGLTLNSTATLGYDAGIFFDGGSQTLGGSGTVVFSNSASEGLIANADNMTLTIGSGINIQGGNNYGANIYYGAVIGYSNALGGGSNTTIINQGTIDPNVSGMSIVINPNGSFINQGTIEATNGAALYVGGTMAGLGTFNANGGTVGLIGTLNNTGTTLPLTAASGSLTLYGGMINGGTISGTGGAQLLATYASGTLNGVTLNANLNLTAGNGNVNVHVINGLTLNSTATLGYGAAILFDAGSQTLGGTGTVVFSNSAYEGLIANADNMTLTIGPGITVQGGNNDGASTSYGAVIGYSSGGYFTGWFGGSNTSVINQGTIDPNVSGMSIIVNPNGSFINQGTIEATNGAGLYLGGTMAGLGTFNANGGTVALIGTLNNTGTTLPLTAASGSLTLYGGTINGGTISATGGAQLLATYASGTLNGVTLNANLDVTAAGASVHVVNGLTLNSTATLGYDSVIFFDGGSQTLGGSGTVVFSDSAYEGLIANANNMTLTIGPGITVQGGNNSGPSTSYGAVIGYSSGGYFTGWFGGINTSVINQGTIDPNVSGMSIIVNPNGSGSFINQGTIGATNGAALYANGATSVNGTGVIAGTGTNTLTFTGSLTGNTTNALGYSPLDTVQLNGSGTAASPQSLEAMSADVGGAPTGYVNNFAYGALNIGGNDYVQLVDQSHNSTGSGAEAVYCVSLTVPAGSTLDLNGLHLYAGSANVQGTIVNGVVSLAALPPAVAVVSGNGQPIADNSIDTSTANGTYFGNLAQNTPGVNETYTIANTGIATLSVGSVTLPSGFTLISAPPSSITAHSSGTFTVQLTTDTANTFGGDLSFATSDSANNPYSFVIQGEVTPAEPSAAISYNAVAVVNGDRSTSMANGTDLGSTAQGGAPVAHTFTISNTGNAYLNLGVISLPAGFSLVGSPSASIAAGGTTSFTLGLGTSYFGVFSGIVSFATNDPYNNPYTFEVTGTVTAAPAPITGVTYNSVTIVDHSIGTSTASGTNFGFSLQGGSPVVHTFTISNTGNAILNLGTINVPSGYSIVGTPATSVLPNSTASFTFGLSTTNVGTFNGNVSFSTNDANNNPFVFAVTGEVGPSTAAYLAVTPPNLQSTVAGQSTSFALGSFIATNATAPFTVTVNWGDGLAASVFNVSAAGTIPAQAHTYTSYGSVTATISVQDSLGNVSNTATFPVSVAPVPATITVTPPANQTATPAQTNWILLGSFTQANGIAPYNVTVNWGDGSAQSYFSLTNAGALPATPHTYANTGTDTVTVTITDSVGHTSNSALFTVNIAYAIINLTAPINQNATTGQASAISLGSFTAANATAPYTVTVNWGDGGAQSIFAVASAGTIAATLHTYAVDGNYTVTVTVMDSNSHTSNSVGFIVTAGPAAMLAFSQPPATTQVGTASGPVTVVIEDPYGSTVANDGSIVTLSLSSGTFANGQGNISLPASGGIATFSSLVINAKGNYTLTASDGTLAVANAPLDVTPIMTTTTINTYGPNPSNSTQAVSFSVTVTGGIPDGEAVSLEDASNNNAVVASGTLSGGSATLVIPAGTLSAGSHNIFAVYGGDSTFAASQSSTVSQVSLNPVTVTSVVVNANIAALAGAQRSMVDSIVYTFSEAVTIATTGTDQNPGIAIAVHGAEQGTVPTLNWSSPDGGVTWIVTFSGSSVVGNSIANGVYDITLNPTAITSVAHPSASFTPRGTDTFYRLYGDYNGDKVVNATDNLHFKSAITTYNPIFDYDNNGAVNATDNLHFKASISFVFNADFTTTI
jgi:hypothetical protein